MNANDKPATNQVILDLIKKIEEVRDNFRAIVKEDLRQVLVLQETWEIIGLMAHRLAQARAEIKILRELPEPQKSQEPQK
jgi:hypothetical protein